MAETKAPSPPQAAPAGDKKSRKRNPAHPVITLQDAIEKAKKIHEMAPRRSVAVAVAASAWELSPTSSTLDGNLSALKQYGLLEEDSSGTNARMVKLTELGNRIIMDKREVSPERDRAIREAALLPKIMQELWAESQQGVVKDPTLLHYLTVERKEFQFYEDMAPRVIQTFRSNISFAKLGTGDKLTDKPDGGCDPPPEKEVKPGQFVMWESNGQAMFDARRVTGITEDGEWAFVEGSQTGVPVSELEVVAAPADQPPPNPKDRTMVAQAPPNPDYKPHFQSKQEVFALERGQIRVEWPESLSSDEVTDVEAWFPILLRKIKRSVRTNDPGSET